MCVCLCVDAYHEVKVPIKAPHLHPFYGSENIQHIILRLYSGAKQSPTAYTVGLAGSKTHGKATCLPLVDCLLRLLSTLRSVQSKQFICGMCLQETTIKVTPCQIYIYDTHNI